MKIRLLWWTLMAVGLLCTVQAQDEDDEDIDLEDEIEDDESGEEAPTELVQRPEYKTPVPSGEVYLAEPFDTEEDFRQGWVLSQAKKDDIDEDIAKYDGVWLIDEAKDNPLTGDLGLVLKSKAKHHAVAAKLDRPYEFNGKPFIVQYEVKFQNGQECGGAYIKLLSQQKGLKLENFMDKTGYTIMFGPDKCGNDNKLHFIFRHKNPINGEFEEKHAKKPTGSFDGAFSDKKTHLYTLVVSPDNTFEIFLDQNLINSGSLLEDVEPAVNPPKEITDPDDKKPEDWDEREKIPDPDATKPDDWDETQPEMIEDEDAIKPEGWLDDEPELIPDPEAEKPSDWDEDMDGEWEAPMISNPECESAPGCGEWNPPMIKNPNYKGKWKPAMIENPDYRGKWRARKIPNPNFFEDRNPYKMTPIAAVGLELWSMSNDILFDNFIITDSKEVADTWAADTWELKRQVELAGAGSGKSVVQAVMDATHERPWLWAVFIIVVCLPVVLIIAYCCMPGNKQDDIARRKKTDEAEEDDEEQDDEPNAGGDAKGKKSKKPSKGALEENEDEEDEDNNDDADDEDDNGTQPAQKRASPRKRKGKSEKAQ